MVSLVDKILHLYPNAKPGFDFEVMSDYGVSSIYKWNSAFLGEQPTQQFFDEMDVAPIIEKKLRNQLALIRYAKEVAGITVGTQPVTTFRDEMPVWQGMLLDMTLRPGATTSFEYKPRGGANVTLTPQQVGRIYECFAWYVNACFATERYLASQIGTLTAEQIEGLANTDSTWPQRQFEWVAP